MIGNIQIEICCGSITDVLTASAFEEVDRIELNSALELGGLTASLATLKAAKKYSSKKIVTMVRPRPAGFFYNEAEKETMFADAKIFLENGADGIVFGFLDDCHQIDEETTRKMTDMIHACHKEAIFHKAFDAAEYPFRSMETLIGCGIDRVLTSGREPDVTAGTPVLQQLQERYGNVIEILPGGGVNAANAKQVLQNTGCTQIHMSAKSNAYDLENYYAVDEDRIREVLDTLR